LIFRYALDIAYFSAERFRHYAADAAMPFFDASDAADADADFAGFFAMRHYAMPPQFYADYCFSPALPLLNR
jgi:hypothetical protein